VDMPTKGDGGSSAAEPGVVIVVDVEAPLAFSSLAPLGRTTRHGPRPGARSSLLA
jgi:hypothetical protein